MAQVGFSVHVVLIDQILHQRKKQIWNSHQVWTDWTADYYYFIECNIIIY